MSRLIAWFVDNPVAANLMMAVLVFGGLASLASMRQEEFPSIDLEMIQVSVAYLGATPLEVEEAVCVRIEEAIEGTPGIDYVGATAAEGACGVVVVLVSGTDTSWVTSEIENRVNRITTFPNETERPVVSYVVITEDVFYIAISGDADERTLKSIGQGVRDDLAALPGISQVSLDYVRPYEISIEVSEQALRRHGLTFDQVANAVRQGSLDLPAGSIKTKGGEILLRSQGQAYSSAEFEPIVVLARADGTTVTLGEIATIVDGFKEDDVRAYFDGKPAVIVGVNRVGDEDILEVAKQARAYVERARARMPDGVELTIWNDESEALKSRINVLVGTAAGGLVLVLVVLALILRFRLAMWVAAGIPIALLGALMVFPLFDFAISTLAIMGFILVLGIVVDDAIVVGERIFAHEGSEGPSRAAAVKGTSDVAIPVVFGVLTTIAAFCPLLFIPGRMGQFFVVLGATVVLCLTFSLLEAQLILPSHLAHRRHDPDKRGGRFSRIQDRIAGGLEHVVERRYRPALERVLEWRYLALATAVGVLILTAALFASGRVVFQFFPGVEGQRVFATITMPLGTPIEHTQAAIAQLEAAADRFRSEMDEREPGAEVVRHVLSSLGKQVSRSGPSRPGSTGGGTHLAQVVMELAPSTEREVTAKEATDRWRELTGPVPDAVELKFEAMRIHAGDAVAIQFVGDDMDELTSASAQLRAALASYEPVFDIADSLRAGKPEVRLALLPEAKHLGITLSQLANQVRTAFYGVEVQRIQRGPDDVRVMVRYPEAERRSLGNLENMRIRTPDGTEIPLASVAHAQLGRGFASIRRTDGRRVVTVTADVDRDRLTPEDLLASLRAGPLPRILADHPGVSYTLEGEQRERALAMSGLARAFALAMLVIYALLAVPLKSYTQPLLIMAAIPFGTVGAILGHFAMGHDLVFFSLLGIVALSGVVVNDSLVLVDYINRQRREGMELSRAVRVAGVTRFRAIFLTSATTFVGLMPLIVSASEATRFVVPIAISLAFGVLAATLITLFLVPSGYIILDDLGRLFQRERREDAEPGMATGG